MTPETTDDQSVLGSLSDTRPTRFGRERGEKPKATAAAKPKPKPKAKTKATAAAKPKPAARRKPPVTEPRAAGPRAVRAGAPSLADTTPGARPKTPPESKSTPPSGTELVTTAIQAAGELAQIGLAVGGRVLKRTVEKLPKP
ncbi:MAG TPA: hypothetical protein VD836_18470 [Solirubrobacteraceae bacterium]|nr:hypothetical protein [Solirubrobacteraceae bacterium]